MVMFSGTEVMVGGVLSSMVMICTATLLLPQASETVYVLVMVVGQVPAMVSVLVTVIPASSVQASFMVTPIASRAATVVTGAGMSSGTQPSMFLEISFPVMTGA